MKARCKRCGESFPVDPLQQSGEANARQRESRRARDADLFAGAATAGAASATTETNATRALNAPTETSATSHATPLTGERNESSVLFSLAALARQAPAPQAPTVTESSALIDIRALVSASNGDASTRGVDDIMNLGGGGAFARLFVPPLAPPVSLGPPNEEAARLHKRPTVLGAMALALVAMVGVAAFVVVRSRSHAPAMTAVTKATAISAPADDPSVAGTAPSNAVVVAASQTPPVSGTQPAAVTPLRTGTTSNVAPPARSAAHLNDTQTIAAQVPTVPTVGTPSAATKCCPGESEMACHMRLSAGAACGAEPPGSTVTSARPFDRPAAARALGINVASCKRGDVPTGAGHLKVTFQPSGSVSAVDVDPPYAGTPTGACIAQRYRGASVPPFAGGPLAVGKSFVIE